MKNADDKIPNFIVIESDVLLDKNLTSTDKILYSIICVLSNNKYNACYAQSKYICKLANIQDRQLRNCLDRLKRHNYVIIKIKKGNKRYIKPVINKLLEIRKANQNLDVFDYDWLNEEN